MSLISQKDYSVMNDSIKVIYYDIPCRIRGFTKKTNDDIYYIVLNSRLSREQNQMTLVHELEHIKNGDFYNYNNVQELEFLRHT